MNEILPDSRFAHWRRWGRSGSALLIVLACVALLTLLITAFLLSAQNEFSSSTSYSRGVNTKLLAETTLNTVVAQISQATKSTDALSGTVVAWASQPGMIRTYDTSGNAVSYYKLYSWDNMAAPTLIQNDEMAPDGWDAQKGIYTDLNEPVETPANGKVYPIIDGNNLETGLTDIYGNPVSGKSYHLSTEPGSNADVEGFSIDTSSLPQQSSGNPDNPDVPMPVKWMYILQDGTTVVAQPASNGSTTAASVPGASATNRIVGRIAFWTDDETSKVNINTASEGNFWDIPLADGREERNLAANIPVQGEYQRIPGHPATVSLSSVFGAKSQFFPSNYTVDANYLTAPADNTTLTDLFSLTPRMMWGGSQFGTAPNTPIAETATSPAYFPYTGNTPGTQFSTVPAPLGTKASRLYDSIDELVFSPTLSGTTRSSNPPLSQEDLEQAKFFITADSRAPEVTLFNTPRISIWPITWPNTGIAVTNPAPPTDPLSENPYYTNTAPPQLRAEEKLLAFCGTVGGYPYYFQRQNAFDTSSDYTNIPRNKSLYTYLDNLTSQPIPGFGGDFQTKYGADRDQILTEIFDYIRSGPNLNNTVAGTSGASHTVDFNYNFAPDDTRDLSFGEGNGTAANGGNNRIGGGTVVPIQISSPSGVATMGQGRFSTITEAALVFYAVDRQEPYNAATPTVTHFINYKNIVNGVPVYTYPAQTETGAQTTRLGMFLMLNVYNPTTGYLVNAPYFIVKIGGPSFTATGLPSGLGGSFNFPSPSPGTVGTQSLFDISTSSGGWILAFDSFMGSVWPFGIPRPLGANYSKSLNKNAYDPRSYPFYGDPITVTNTDTQFSLSGGLTTIQIYPVNADRSNGSPNSASFQPVATPMQTLTIDFSKLNGTYPMPIAPRWNDSPASSPIYNSDSVPTVSGVQIPHPAYEVYNSGAYYFSRTNTPNQYSDVITGSAPVAPFNGPWDMRNLQARAQVSVDPGTPMWTNGTVNSQIGGYGLPMIAENVAGAGNTGPVYADTTISIRLDPSQAAGHPNGDARLLALNANPPSSYFVPHYAILSTLLGQQETNRGAHSILMGINNDQGYSQYESMFGYPGQASPNSYWPLGTIPLNAIGGINGWVGQNTEQVTGITGKANPVSGDFNNGYGNWEDGAIIPKPDDSTYTIGTDPFDGSIQTPYFGGYNGIQSGTEPYFSPARQLSGPVMFGALPSGVKAGVPWRQLLFNPNPQAGATHIGFSSPPDHLLLDDFWMPVVEPYAISEPLSTAGKINMNYQIEPFTYINRKTALYAAMKSDRIFAIPNAALNNYKTTDSQSGGGGYTNTWGFHFPIDIFETLAFFDYRFSTLGRLFISPSEICSMFLYPKNNPVYQPPAPFALPQPDLVPSNANIQAWWGTGSAGSNTMLTGANGRQQPYTHLYSLLTTKSNTFQVHMRVQVLIKSKTGNQSIFDENAGDSIGGEYRGSAIVERYVDANASGLPDFATTFTTAGSNTLDPYYRFRIANVKAFTPQ